MPTHPAIVDAEHGILGGIFLHRDPLELLASIPLGPEDFYDPKAQSVFAAMRNLEARGGPIDIVTVEQELERVGNLASLGGVAFLGEVAMRVPTPDNVLAYARDVKNAAITRRLRVVLAEVQDEARRGEMNAEELLSLAQAGITELDHYQPTNAIPVGDIAAARWTQVNELNDARARGELALSGLPTGVDALDAKIGGYQPGIVHLIAARPAMGKSSLALSGAAACSHAGIGAHVFSMEESEQAYGDRVLARMSGISAERIRNADVMADVGHLVRAVAALRGRRHWLVDFTSGLTAEQIIRRVRRHRRANETRVVFVDYVQIVRKRDPRQTDNDAWAEIVTQFADAAKQDAIAYVVLSQLNRELEKRPDKRPQLSDLRGSGGLEERSRMVLALYRGSVYSKEPKDRADWKCDCAESVANCVHKPTADEWKAMAEIHILKNSNGRASRVRCSWDGPTTRIW